MKSSSCRLAVVLAPFSIACTAARAQQQPLAPPSAPVAPAAPLTAGFDDHFFVQSADGATRVELGALLQVHATAFERGLAGRESDVFLRRFRLEIGGRIDGEWLFNLEPKFTEREFEFEEAWLGVEPERGLLVMAGRMKEPFSLEEMRSQKHLSFVNFSLWNQLVPAEGHGLTLAGSRHDGALEWGAALYRGGEEGVNGGSEAAGRLVWRPFAGGPALARELALGVAATGGRAHDALGGDELKTEARVPFATFDGAAEADGARTRVGLELEWRGGPCEVTAEALRMERALEGPLGDEVARAQGGYLGVSWVLSGEARGKDGVRPARPFTTRGGSGLGALELAARLTRLQLNDGWFESGALPATSDPRRVTSLDVGLNWYPAWRVRVKLHGVMTRYARDVLLDGERRGEERALLLQLQLHF
ncbi:MAG: hypothetical protein JNL90_05155 [Planctomycetes bacterium]|nr:hypothetical protein [Planctomycetota bacterium]